MNLDKKYPQLAFYAERMNMIKNDLILYYFSIFLLTFITFLFLIGILSWKFYLYIYMLFTVSFNDKR